MTMKKTETHRLVVSAAVAAATAVGTICFADNPMVSRPALGQAQTPTSSPAETYRAIHAPGYPKVIVPGDYPDPTIIRDGRDCYMTHSAFDHTRGFPICHSTDLVNCWPLVRALKQTGSYAPDLATVNGKFHIY